MSRTPSSIRERSIYALRTLNSPPGGTESRSMTVRRTARIPNRSSCSRWPSALFQRPQIQCFLLDGIGFNAVRGLHMPNQIQSSASWSRFPPRCPHRKGRRPCNCPARSRAEPELSGGRRTAQALQIEPSVVTFAPNAPYKLVLPTYLLSGLSRLRIPLPRIARQQRNQPLGSDLGRFSGLPLEPRP